MSNAAKLVNQADLKDQTSTGTLDRKVIIYDSKDFVGNYIRAYEEDDELERRFEELQEYGLLPSRS